MTERVVVLISGGGSNLRALLEALPDSGISAEVVAVGADREAPGLAHATERGIPTFVVPYSDFSSREDWGLTLEQECASYAPDTIVLSGLMRLLPASFVRRFPGQIINTHPAYLPEFPGATAVKDALAAGVHETGASVILVDEGVDTGPVLAKERVSIESSDTEESLHDRIKLVERRLLLDVLHQRASTPKKGASS